MIVLRVFLVVALAYAANAGEDLKLGYKLVDCLQKAMILGIPALNYKTHNPLVITSNISWTGNIGDASTTLNLSNMVWYGLPQWNVTAKQRTKDTEPRVVFDYIIHWDRFLLTSKYSLVSKAKFISSEVTGDMNITMRNTDWRGRVNFTKPGFNLTEGINDLTVYWTAHRVGFSFTGLGVLEKSVSSTLALLVKTFLNYGGLGNQLGEHFKEKLNTNYFAQNEKIDAILDFCRTTPYPDN